MPHTQRTRSGKLKSSGPPARHHVDLIELCAQVPLVPCSSYCRWKRVIDLTLALLLFIPAMSLVGVLILLVRAASPGPGLYSQLRVGKHGRIFTLYKIRTMRHDAEVGTGAVWTQTNDPRITRLGAFLRKVHMDELPQILNVLKGEMSLVGPRPERPEFVYTLAEQIAGYADRLAVLPGVTGLSQINLPPDTDLNSVRRKQILDLEYIRTASFWLDLRMMLCTSLRLIGIGGALATRLTFVQRPIPHVETDASTDEPIRRQEQAGTTGMTPAALASPILRQALTDLAATLSDEDKHLQQQIHQLLVLDPSGNGHGKPKHFDHPHESHNGARRLPDRETEVE